jgi:hypothetical protein
VRQAHGLVEFDDSGLGVGSDLALGCSQRVGGLQGMSSLDTASAVAAAADVDVELSSDGLARDFGLELLCHFGFVDSRTAVGAGVGEGCVENFADLFGGWRLSVTVFAVQVSGFASWSFWVIARWSFSEGCGLPFAVSSCLFELGLQLREMGLERFDLTLLELDGFQQLLVSWSRFGHRQQAMQNTPKWPAR